MPAEKRFTIGHTQVVDMLVTSATSNGAFSLFISDCGPGDGPPPHVHTLEDEFFFPFEGEFEVFNGETWKAISEHGVYGPRNKVHTWRNAGSTRGKLLTVATGNSFDVFLEKFGAMRLPDQMAEVISMSAEHGISYVLPPHSKMAKAEEGELVNA